MSTLAEAIELIRMGNREEGRQVLDTLLETDEGNEDAWLWMTAVVDSDEDREICLDNVLALNPDNVLARRGIDDLRNGTFNLNQFLGDMLDEAPQAETEEPTFLDEFVFADEADDDLELPSTMRVDSPVESTAESGGRRSNPRLLIVLALIALVIVGLGGVTAVALFFGLGGDSEDPVMVSDTPVQVENQATTEPTATTTPIPPTAEPPTPEPPTSTPALVLPTARPTNQPSPTSTQVVSPTPPRR